MPSRSSVGPSGDDAIRYLGAAKTDLEKILRACKQYPAVAARWQQDYGMSILQLELQIEGIKDQIGDMRRGNRGSGRRGGNQWTRRRRWSRPLSLGRLPLPIRSGRITN